ncbi:MAG: GIY-YIG nuclease family protein [Ferruginibacter sp.]
MWSLFNLCLHFTFYSQTLTKYYIGFTATDIQSRLSKHLSNDKGFTAKAKDWIVAYTELYADKKAAMQREKQLKNWKSSERIRELILRSSTQ